MDEIVECACGCGQTFTRIAPYGRVRRFAPGHRITGRYLSDETRRKISTALTNPTPQTRAKLAAAMRGPGNPKWKGGRSQIRKGYVRLLRPQHPRCSPNGYVPEHRLVMEAKLGRYLEPHEIPHHKNGDLGDNRPENLELFSSQSEHSKRHWEERRTRTV